ncbi:prolyl 4-hydroxylase subunit alpha-1-like isoform X2 [Drosophila biarmipes]|nr:prolyl 4-hydroxylase subunit alpha-1-like isoform X2 [Drosophila biarmipes]
MKEIPRKRKNSLDNPFFTYSFMRHMQADWLMWHEYLGKPVGLDQLAYMQSRKSSMPQERDFMDAADGVTRMQGTYQLLASDIANGLLDEVQYSSSLTAIDCLELAWSRIYRNYLPSAEQWILAGIEAHDRPNPQVEMQSLRGPKKADLYRELGQLRAELQNHDGAVKAYQMALKESPDDPEIYQEYRSYEKVVLNSPERGADTFKQDEEYEAYDRAQLSNCCSGRCKLSPKLKKLHCFYNHATSPFLRLAPIKTEILSVDPFISLLHGMISPKESALIRSSSKEHILPSNYYSGEVQDFVVGSSRFSKSVWYENSYNEATLKITERLGDATGLDMNHAELFQVINYGLGGFFETHMDLKLAENVRFQGTADRMATAIFYLSNVTQGGATLFPSLNITVFPKFGSALFWFNLDHKGNNQLDTTHTGCPVIVGSKWVVSKFIEDSGQEFRRPCFGLR